MLKAEWKDKILFYPPRFGGFLIVWERNVSEVENVIKKQ